MVTSDAEGESLGNAGRGERPGGGMVWTPLRAACSGDIRLKLRVCLADVVQQTSDKGKVGHTEGSTNCAASWATPSKWAISGWGWPAALTECAYSGDSGAMPPPAACVRELSLQPAARLLRRPCNHSSRRERIVDVAWIRSAGHRARLACYITPRHVGREKLPAVQVFSPFCRPGVDETAAGSELGRSRLTSLPHRRPAFVVRAG